MASNEVDLPIPSLIFVADIAFLLYESDSLASLTGLMSHLTSKSDLDMPLPDH